MNRKSHWHRRPLKVVFMKTRSEKVEWFYVYNFNTTNLHHISACKSIHICRPHFPCVGFMELGQYKATAINIFLSNRFFTLTVFKRTYFRNTVSAQEDLEKSVVVGAEFVIHLIWVKNQQVHALPIYCVYPGIWQKLSVSSVSVLVLIVLHVDIQCE